MTPGLNRLYFLCHNLFFYWTKYWVYIARSYLCTGLIFVLLWHKNGGIRIYSCIYMSFFVHKLNKHALRYQKTIKPFCLRNREIIFGRAVTLAKLMWVRVTICSLCVISDWTPTRVRLWIVDYQYVRNMLDHFSGRDWGHTGFSAVRPIFVISINPCYAIRPILREFWVNFFASRAFDEWITVLMIVCVCIIKPVVYSIRLEKFTFKLAFYSLSRYQFCTHVHLGWMLVVFAKIR